MLATIAAAGAGIDIKSIGFILPLVLYCVIGSMGAAGVGGGNIQASLIVFAMMGLNTSVIFLLYGFDFFIGILRPAMNLNGSIIGGLFAQKWTARGKRRDAYTTET